jgi:hypothetical protein
MSLDTLANVKTRLGITGSGDDSLLSLLQDSADSFIENWCDRDFIGGSYTEYHPGGSEFIYLRNFPVTAVTTVKVDPSYAFGSETIIPATDYTVHSDWGVIQSLAGPVLPHARLGLVNSEATFWTRGPRVVQVVYATATGAVPNDVKEAYARLIGNWYRRAKTEAAENFLSITHQKFGDAALVFASEQPGALTDDVRELLAPYRAPRI